MPRVPYAPYSSLRVVLHWISALVILWAIATGFLAAALPRDAAVRALIDQVNPQVTTLFIPVFTLRLVLYLHGRPWHAAARWSWGERLAAAGHAMLYGCITGVLASGVLMMPHPWRLLGEIPMPTVSLAPVAMRALSLVHQGLCEGLALLVGGHLLAVLIHHMCGHPVLNRMRLSRGARFRYDVVAGERPGLRATLCDGAEITVTRHQISK